MFIMKLDCYRLHFSSPVIGVSYMLQAGTGIVAGPRLRRSTAHQFSLFISLFILEYFCYINPTIRNFDKTMK